MGKAVVIALLLSAALAGLGLWYTATRAYYAPVDGPVTLTLWPSEDPGDTPAAIPASDVSAIASGSSPLGFRACFTHELDLNRLGTDLPTASRDRAQPTIAPGWFDCFDAEAIGTALERGEARAFLAWPNAAYGVDRVVALTADGRGWAWHELNDCGRKAYDGTPVGRACPDRATFTPLTEGRF